MTLKFKLTKEEYDSFSTADATKGFSALYAEKDGAFYLQVDGAVSDVKLKEFRDNNIELMKKNDEMAARLKAFEGLDDPEAARTALKKLEEMTEEQRTAKDKIDELLEQRTQRLKQDYDAKIKALETNHNQIKTKFDELYGQHASLVIDNAIQLAINEVAKPLEGVMEDIISRGRRVFRMSEEFTPEARDNEGNPLFSKDGSSPLSIKEWAGELPSKAPWFFEATGGSGGPGGTGATGGKKLAGYTREELMRLPASERLKVIHKAGATGTE